MGGVGGRCSDGRWPDVRLLRGPLRFWVVPVQDACGKLTLWVGGTANRNRDAFEHTFKQLVEADSEGTETETRGSAETAAAASRKHRRKVSPA